MAAIALTAEILQHPQNRARIQRAALAKLRSYEAAEAAFEAEQRLQLEAGTKAQHAAELAKCADGFEGLIHWVNEWVWTYNPKLLGVRGPDGRQVPLFLPFRLFPRQVEVLRWIHDRVENQEPGAMKKSRDIGATYLFGVYALWRWLFNEVDGFNATFMSRDLDLVDELGNSDSIFEKLRIMLRRLPTWMLPPDFDWNRHSRKGMLTNPNKSAEISGDGGKNAGRGGRSSMLVLDEAAFIDNAEAIEAAVSGNTDCILQVSSANGMGNLFFRKCHGGLPAELVIEYHYRDDPRKTPEWVAFKRRTTDAVVWASEYEIDFAASLEGVCVPAKYVRAAQELRRRVQPSPRRTPAVGGLDVGAGKAKSVFVSRNGPWVRKPKSRGDPDTIQTAWWALEHASAEGCGHLNYDAPGVGVGVASALKHVPEPHETTVPLFRGKVFGINTGEGAPQDRVWPDGATSKDRFGNLKAEIWWLVRTAAQKSWELLAYMDDLRDEDGKPLGVDHPLDECLLLPSGDPESEMLAAQLPTVLVERNVGGKLMIESKASLKRRNIPSPDYAEALTLTFVDKRSVYDIGALA